MVWMTLSGSARRPVLSQKFFFASEERNDQLAKLVEIELTFGRAHRLCHVVHGI